MLRILNVEPLNYSDKATQILREIGDVALIELDRNGLLAHISNVDVLIVRLAFKVDRAVIDAGTHLKAIVTATTGLDHIDVEYAEKKGIQVLSLRGEVDFLRSIPATAELTWGQLLALMRNIPQAFVASQSGQWDRDRFKGRDLAGKRLGIVGLGRIGEKIARFGLAFGMKVSAFDPYRQDWLPHVDRYSTLNDMLPVSDILSLHVPLNDSTYHMVGHRELGLLPKHAVLINTARGGILDSAALLLSLQSGMLAGAALDVIEGESNKEQISANPLIAYAREHTNLLITPHIGGATYESMAATEVFMANKLKTWFEHAQHTVKAEGTKRAAEIP